MAGAVVENRAAQERGGQLQVVLWLRQEFLGLAGAMVENRATQEIMAGCKWYLCRAAGVLAAGGRDGG